MAKQYKIKRYRKYGGGSSFRAKPHPLTIILGAVALVVLGGLGAFLYQPIVNLLSQDHAPSEISLPDPDPEEISQATTDPEPEPARITSGQRAAYLPAATATDPAALGSFIDSLSGSEINTVLFDIKDEGGNLLFQTQNSYAAEWGAISADAVNLSALTSTLEAAGLSLSVRLSAFRDPIAAGANREFAITYQDTQWLWLDAVSVEAGGKPWLNPYSAGAKDYLTSLALEAADAGAKMVVLENVQFPTGSTTNAGFGDAAQGISRQQALQDFVDELTATLLEKGVRTAVSLNATVLGQENENTTRYGGSPLAITGDTLVINALPYQFGGGGYTMGDYVIDDPVANPGSAVDTVLNYVSVHLPPGAETTVIPILQGGSESVYNSSVAFTAAEVSAQLGALSARSLDEYILYSSSGAYLLP